MLTPETTAYLSKFNRLPSRDYFEEDIFLFVTASNREKQN
jgi:hypothetical protein